MLTALFFADDLLLLSKTPKRGMNKLLRIVSRSVWTCTWSLQLLRLLFLPMPKMRFFGHKYSGVTIQVRGRSMIGVYEKDMICKVTNYEYAIMNLSRGVLDRSMVAKRLWEVCAIPSIWYCVEAVTLKKSTIEELERLQGLKGRSQPHLLWFLPGWTQALCLWHTKSRLDRLCSSWMYWRLCPIHS